MQDGGGAGHPEPPGGRGDLQLQGKERPAPQSLLPRGDFDTGAGQEGNSDAAEAAVREACFGEKGGTPEGSQQVGTRGEWRKEKRHGKHGRFHGNQKGEERQGQQVHGQREEQQREAWELVLALLPPRDIACCAQACTLLAAAARNVTSRRCSDACQGFEPTPVPFVSGAATPAGEAVPACESVPAGANWATHSVPPGPRYAYFQYARTNLRKLPRPFLWGAPSPGDRRSLAAGHGGSKPTAEEPNEFNGIPADVLRALGPSGCPCSGPMCGDPAHGPCSCGLTGEGSPAYSAAEESAVTERRDGAQGDPMHSDTVTRDSSRSDTVTTDATPGSPQVGLLRWAQERAREAATGASCQGSPERPEGSSERRCDTEGGVVGWYQLSPKRRKAGSAQEWAAEDVCEGGSRWRGEGNGGRGRGEHGDSGREACGEEHRGERGSTERAQHGGRGREHRRVSGDSSSRGPHPGPLVFECGPACACGPCCPHRLSQQPLHWPLEVRWEGAKGWGLFPAGHIPAGAFLCQYAGEVLTSQAARLRQRERDSAAAACRAAGGRPPPSFLMHVNEHLPSQRASLRTNIDPTSVGSLGRFMNHRCDGGTVVQCILRYTGCPLPAVGLFAARDIAPGEELTFSYGEPQREGAQGGERVCHCGAGNCSGALPTCAS